jgi:kynurenine formamidase
MRIRFTARLKRSFSILLLTCLAAAPHTAQGEAALIKTVLSAQVIELNHVWDKNAPVLKNPPYGLGLFAGHMDWTIPGGTGFAEDMMFFSGQHGAPTIDAIGHVSTNGKLYGGLDAVVQTGSAGLLALGIETYPKEKLVNRGVLLDIARYKAVEALEPGYEITVADIEATMKAQKVSIGAGDSVLFRTGYGRYYNTGRDKYMGLRPGPGQQAAQWLADRKIFLAGADSLSFEVYPHIHPSFPAHRILVSENGIYIVENLNLEELASVLAAKKHYEFVLVLNPLRIKGATGSPLNAFAIVP